MTTSDGKKIDVAVKTLKVYERSTSYQKICHFILCHKLLQTNGTIVIIQVGYYMFTTFENSSPTAILGYILAD